MASSGGIRYGPPKLSQYTAYVRDLSSGCEWSCVDSMCRDATRLPTWQAGSAMKTSPSYVNGRRSTTVVGEYVQLRNAGGGALKGLCPFHDEKSPSFNVSNGLWHCLAGETRVLTWRGLRPISELAGGTHRILGRDGRWHDAPFYSFGVQPLMRIVLGRNGQRKEIYATAEHRWFVRAGKKRDWNREVTTRDLKPDHRLAHVFPGARTSRSRSIALWNRVRHYVRGWSPSRCWKHGISLREQRRPAAKVVSA